MRHESSTYAEAAVGLCPTPTELRKMTSRRKGCVGKWQGRRGHEQGKPPEPWDGISGDVTGGYYSLVRAVVRPPLTERAQGAGAAASGETAQSCAVSSAARAQRTRVLGGRGEAGGGGWSAAPGPCAAAGSDSGEGTRRARVGTSGRRPRVGADGARVALPRHR
ncbi:hypothetical protein H8959_012452 [Pygathrix nigripes]